MSETFWLNNPLILMNKNYITNIWPQTNQPLVKKLNAITRFVLLLTILGYFLTKSIKIVIAGVVTLIAIVVIYNTQSKQTTEKKQSTTENFTNPQVYKKVKSRFTSPTKQNPLMNVALPEIKYNPKRKAAAPSFNPKVENEINDSVKESLDPRLFHDLGDGIEFSASMRNYYTTANTQVPNDQKAFAEFCYGNMAACKDGDGEQCVKNNYRWTNP